jgi:hypothetical protein
MGIWRLVTGDAWQPANTAAPIETTVQTRFITVLPLHGRLRRGISVNFGLIGVRTAAGYEE